MKAILFSAGLGKRMRPLTDNAPKALVQVGKTTLLERNIRYLQSQGIHDLIVNVHHFPEAILSEIHLHQGWGSRIMVSDESAGLLETGGGLAKAAWFFEGESDFVAMNVDILTDLSLTKMIEAHIGQDRIATLAVTDRSSTRQLYFDDRGLLRGWQNLDTKQTKGPIHTMEEAEKERLRPRSFSGVHVLSSKVLEPLGTPKKFSIMDFYLNTCHQMPIAMFDHSEGKLIDVGRPESVQKAEEMFGL